MGGGLGRGRDKEERVERGKDQHLLQDNAEFLFNVWQHC